MFWLQSYTNHGQKLELPDYIGTSFTEATEDAEDKSFVLIVNDSIHVVGKPGGEILDQNPKPYSKVKENRKIYVTISKYNADVLDLNNLPALYGMDYESKKRELSYLDIESKIKGYVYDPGEPDHILEVWYNGKRIISPSGNAKNVNIEKGGELQFVLSKREGGQTEIPDLKCKTLNIAKFILDNNKLKLGSVLEEGEITNPETAYIINQNPGYNINSTIARGAPISVTISQEKPKYCQ